MANFGRTGGLLAAVGVLTAWGSITWAEGPTTPYAQQAAADAQKAAQGSKPAAPTQSAVQLVREALRNRTLGGHDADGLLARALAVDPRSESARWQSGFVRESGNWIKYDAVADGDAYRRLLDRYETERGSHPDTLQGHAAMAGWCRAENLDRQERAHWFKVLEFDADHEIARVRLGFVRVGQNWVTRSEIENTQRRRFDAELAFKKWSTALRPIRIALESDDPTRVAAARKKLTAIRDPEAIPAMEAMLSRLNLEASTAVVFTIRQMTGPDAAVGLARQAVFADWYPVGKEAAEALRDYDPLSYVPLMLSALSTPPSDKFQVRIYPGAEPGRLLVRYEFERERQDKTEKVTHDVSYGLWSYSTAGGKIPVAQSSRHATASNYRLNVFTLNGSPGRIVFHTGDYNDEILRARAEGDRAQVEGQIEEESRSTQELNRRICRALRTAAAEAGPEMQTDDPRTWWTWWTKRREVFVAGQKPVVQSEFVSEALEYTPPARRVLTLAPVPVPVRTMSCLVAGTTVYTDVGPRPVERIRLGDRVLAQNVETGELSYRAVLEPTVRPAAPTVVLKFGDRKIQATGGHPFWAVGRGWTMAREFAPGMRMASVAGTVEVTGIEPAGDLKAYNLVVDEFHTYFVGDDLVLSHDNLPPEPTRGDLPGEAADKP
jgi:hypothetical protein